MPRLEARAFDRRMTSGRTAPLLIQCIESGGDESQLVPVVVKARGNHQLANGVRALLSEALGAKFALYFGLGCPLPAVVHVSRLLASSVSDAVVRQELSDSVGWNYGSLLVQGWYVFRQLNESNRSMAANVFAFDLFAQNWDRRADGRNSASGSPNPNLMVAKGSLMVLDHEHCFMVDDTLARAGRSPRETFRAVAKGHVLYPFLRGTVVDFQEFLRKLEGLSDTVLEDILNDVPAEWHGDAAGKIMAYVREIRSDMPGFKRTLMEALV